MYSCPIDRRYPLSEITDAFRYLGKAREGKVVITI